MRKEKSFELIKLRKLTQQYFFGNSVADFLFNHSYAIEFDKYDSFLSNYIMDLDHYGWELNIIRMQTEIFAKYFLSIFLDPIHGIISRPFSPFLSKNSKFRYYYYIGI